MAVTVTRCGIDPDHDGNAARPRENGELAGRTATAEHQPAATPIDGQEFRRRQVLRRKDGVRRDGRVRRARVPVHHALAQILQIGGPAA